MDPLSAIASTIAIIQAISKSYEIIKKISGLPAAFEEVNRQLPIVDQTLRNAKSRLRRDPDPTDEEESIISSIINPCQEKAGKLKEIFDKLQAQFETENGPVLWGKIRTTYRKVLAGTKAHRVESLMSDILKDTELLARNQIFKLAMAQDLAAIEKAIENLGSVGPSLPESDFEGSGTINATQTVASGAHGQQNNVQGGENTFNTGQYIATGSGHTINYETEHRLPIVKDAIFGSAVDQYEPECLEGTRVDVLVNILRWVDDPDGQCIYWLNGKAGTGKSTIARTICKTLERNNLLGASFFFKRGEGDRGNAVRLFTTLADRLATYSTPLKHIINRTLEADPSIPSMAFTVQFNKLILQPLSKSRSFPQTVVIVIDALDECEGDSDQQAIIAVLAQARAARPVDLRIFLTSRPELPSRLGFREIIGKFQDCVLHEVPSITFDIPFYLRCQLSKIRKQAEIWCTFPENWPQERDIQKLADAANPLFIAAATYCRFIADGKAHPVENLKVICMDTSRGAEQLSKTYIPVLKQLAIQDDAEIKSSMKQYSMSKNINGNRLASNFRRIVGTIIILATPLSIPSISRLLCIEETTVRFTLNSLHSILSIPENNNRNGLVRPFHLSLADFLLGPHLQQHKLRRFWIDGNTAHEDLVSQCIELMDTGLKKNICQLNSLGILNPSAKEALVRQYISTELQYACRYWTNHFVKSGERLTDRSEIYAFLRKHLLHWLEAMSLLGRMFEVMDMITVMESTVNSYNDRTFAEFLYDIKRFVLQNQILIDTAPLQVYSSAPLFSPELSKIRILFQPKWVTCSTCRSLQGLSEQSNSPKKWGPLIQTLEGHQNQVNALAFSPVGDIIASGSSDKTIMLWNTTTGQLQQTLKGHRDPILWLSFSYKGEILASGSKDGTIKMWDVTTGQLERTLTGHRATGLSALSFAPNNNTLASGSDDGISILYDNTTDWPVYTLRGKIEPIISLLFSPSGNILVTASITEARLWDVTTGQLQQIIDFDSNISSIAFTPSEGIITYDATPPEGTIKLWNTYTGRHKETLKFPIFSPSEVNLFSPNCNRIATVFWAKGIRIQDTTTGQIQTTLTFGGHREKINTLSFSPGNGLIASGSLDKNIKLWDIVTDRSEPDQTTLVDWVDPVTAITFSPDGNMVASSTCGHIKIWDSNTGKPYKIVYSTHEQFSALSFSPNGKTIVSGSNKFQNKLIKLWDVATGILQRSINIEKFYNLQMYVDEVAKSCADADISSVDIPSKLKSQRYLEIRHPTQTSEIVSVSGSWIMSGGNDVLWLPDNIRGKSAVHGNRVAIGSRLGSVNIITFDF
ncbi:hypothetical protein H072_7653 [Dactylellina haptotyla CBS 200.50]|uniref:NACHT domain-containing protein n=1 Tax=Dactylellina haptotyla (strain CBS 200.50) TaxID=1284197 RepID=S8A6R9_DACHA|nr:hypothetical protein H072_7653 [Dactylellina haptotyla CBS 200.50]